MGFKMESLKAEARQHADPRLSRLVSTSACNTQRTQNTSGSRDDTFDSPHLCCIRLWGRDAKNRSRNPTVSHKHGVTNLLEGSAVIHSCVASQPPPARSRHTSSSKKLLIIMSEEITTRGETRRRSSKSSFPAAVLRWTCAMLVYGTQTEPKPRRTPASNLLFVLLIWALVVIYLVIVALKRKRMKQQHCSQQQLDTGGERGWVHPLIMTGIPL